MVLMIARINQKMAAELVNAATNEKLGEMDWMKNIEICELVAHDQRYNLMLMMTNIEIFNMLRLLILESSIS